MELKSQHLETAAIIILALGVLMGLAAGNEFPIMIEGTRPAYNFGELYSAVYFESKYNVYLAVIVTMSSAIIALVLWFCSTVLFHLEKNRNFNKKAIELLEQIVAAQTGQPATAYQSDEPIQTPPEPPLVQNLEQALDIAAPK